MSRDSKSRVRVSRRNFLAKAMAGASGTAAVFGASTLPIDAQRTAAPGTPALEALRGQSSGERRARIVSVVTGIACRVHVGAV